LRIVSFRLLRPKFGLLGNVISISVLGEIYVCNPLAVI
jgi:hypothetical protein